jgi:hypothetical protein
MSSSVRPGNFYGVWPIIDGKQLNLQWGEIRSNTAETKALVRGSFQDIEDGADSLNALRALIGLAFGEQGFDNKYRLAYNKVTAEFCAQKNDGTEAVPIWEDVWCIRFSDGQFQVVSEGGIQSNAGFYGPLPHDLLAIGEILTSGALGGTQFANPNELYFNTNTGFYLTSVTSGPRAGKPIVNFAFPFGKSKSFPKSGRVWQVAHNFNTSPVLVQAMNDGDVVVIPDKIDVSDPNNAWFYFNEVTSGNALIATGGTGAVELLPVLSVTDGTNSFNNINDLNFNGDNFYLSSDLAGSPVVNLNTADHGALSGLDDDDHLQYSLVDGTRSYTDDVTITAPGATLTLDASGGIPPATVMLQGAGVDFWGLNSLPSNGSFTVSDEVTGTVPLVIEQGSPSTSIRISDTGVGIGTIAATDKLHVAGRGRFDDRVVAEAFYLQPGSGGGLWKSGDDVVVGSSDGDVVIPSNLRVTGDGRFEDKVVAEAFYTIDGGEVGGGSSLAVTDGTNEYTGVLQVNFADSQFYLSSDLSGEPVVNILPQGAAVDHGTLFGLGDDDHPHYSLADGSRSFTGDVTIDTGASSPGALNITSDTTAQLNFQAAGVDEWRLANVGSNFILQALPSFNIPILVAGGAPTSSLFVSDAGYVGLGTSLPTDKLHVAGRGRFDDRVVAEAFYLEPGSGGGLWKSGDDVVVGVSTAGSSLVLESAFNDTAVPAVSLDFETATLTDASPTVVALDWSPTFNTSAASSVETYFTQTVPAITVATADLRYEGHRVAGLFTQALSAAGNGSIRGFSCEYEQTASGVSFVPELSVAFSDETTLKAQGVGTMSQALGKRSYDSTPIIFADGTSDSVDSGFMSGLRFNPRYRTQGLGSVVDFGNLRGVHIQAPSQSVAHVGSAVATSYIGVDVEDLTSDVTVTKLTALRSAIPPGDTNFFLENTGDAKSDFGSGSIAAGRASFDGQIRAEAFYLTGDGNPPDFNGGEFSENRLAAPNAQWFEVAGTDSPHSSSTLHIGTAPGCFINLGTNTGSTVNTGATAGASTLNVRTKTVNFTQAAISLKSSRFVDRANFEDQITAEAFYLTDGGDWSAEELRVTHANGASLVLDTINAPGSAQVNLLEAGVRQWRMEHNSSNSAFQIASKNNNGPAFKIEEDATSGITITGLGRVGIAEADPTARLHVAGHGRFDEQVEATAFYLQPGSGGGMWKSGDDVVVGSKDGGVIVEGDQLTAEAFYLTNGGEFSENVLDLPLATAINLGTAAVSTIDIGNALAAVAIQSNASDGVNFSQSNLNNIKDITGPLGISTGTTKSAMLHVNGDGRFEDKVVAEAFYLTPDGGSNGGGLWQDGADIELGSATGGDINITPATGNVLIRPPAGTAIGAVLRLDASSASFWYSTIQFGVGNSDRWEIRVGASAHLFFTDQLSGGNAMVMETGSPDNSIFVEATTGNIGHGTDAPSRKLHVVGDGLFEDQLNAEAFYLTDGGDWSDEGLSIAGGSAPIVDHLTATAALDFGVTSAQSSSDLTITVTGAADGDTVSLGVPNGAHAATNSCFTAWVISTDTVNVRFNNYSTGSLNPGNTGTFRVDVWKH